MDASLNPFDAELVKAADGALDLHCRLSQSPTARPVHAVPAAGPDVGLLPLSQWLATSRAEA
eukprot:7798870-Lingulodinium_polyedra.AAC.1